MDVKAEVVETDPDQVDTTSTNNRSQVPDMIPLCIVDSIDWVAGLTGGPNLHQHSLCAVDRDEINLSPSNLDIAVDDFHPMLAEEPRGDGFAAPTQTPTSVFYSDSSACSSCSTFTSRKVST